MTKTPQLPLRHNRQLHSCTHTSLWDKNSTILSASIPSCTHSTMHLKRDVLTEKLFQIHSCVDWFSSNLTPTLTNDCYCQSVNHHGLLPKSLKCGTHLTTWQLVSPNVCIIFLRVILHLFNCFSLIYFKKRGFLQNYNY